MGDAQPTGVEPLPRNDLPSFGGDQNHLGGVAKSRRNKGAKKGYGDLHHSLVSQRACQYPFSFLMKKNNNDFRWLYDYEEGRDPVSTVVGMQQLRRQCCIYETIPYLFIFRHKVLRLIPNSRAVRRRFPLFLSSALRMASASAV
jgi:hypothetical protein